MKTKSEKQIKNLKSIKRAEDYLQPLINHVAANRGATKLITEELSKRTGSKEYEANVRQWLNPDRAERVEVRLGVGLFLMDIWQEIQPKAS